MLCTHRRKCKKRPLSCGSQHLGILQKLTHNSHTFRPSTSNSAIAGCLLQSIAAFHGMPLMHLCCVGQPPYLYGVWEPERY